MVREAGGHYLVDDEERTELLCFGVEEAEELFIAGNTATASLNGFDDDGSKGVLRQAVKNGLCTSNIVVRCQDEVVREIGVDFLESEGEGEGAAMIPIFER